LYSLHKNAGQQHKKTPARKNRTTKNTNTAVGFPELRLRTLIWKIWSCSRKKINNLELRLRGLISNAKQSCSGRHFISGNTKKTQWVFRRGGQQRCSIFIYFCVGFVEMIDDRWESIYGDNFLKYSPWWLRSKKKRWLLESLKIAQIWK
jgi:hypothetical protein